MGLPRRARCVRTVRVPTAGPLAQEISAEIKVYFPPHVDHTLVAAAVMRATSEVLEELHADGGWLLLAPIGRGPVVA